MPVASAGQRKKQLSHPSRAAAVAPPLAASRLPEETTASPGAVARPSNNLEQVLQAASTALHEHRLDEAIKLFAQARISAPNSVAAYAGGASALRDAGRFDEAEALLTEAVGRFPRQAGLLIDRAWLAHRRGDVEGALERWAEVRRALPSHHAGYTGAGVTLREAGRFDEADLMLREAMAVLPDIPEPVVEYAWLAHIGRDWPAAIERWREVRARFPDLPQGHVNAAAASREAGQLADAAELLAAAVLRYPDLANPAIELAWLAHHRRDWREAVARWDVVRRRFPDEPAAYTGAALALREAGDLDAAEDLIASACDRFPGNPGFLIEHAHLAMHRHAWAEAIDRWRVVRDRAPDNVAGYTGEALALREQRDFAAAEALLQYAMTRFPGDPGPLIDHAWLAHIAHDWPEAAHRWQNVRSRFPGWTVGYTSGAMALRELGRFDEAETHLDEAIRRFPNERSPWVDRAWLATSRRDSPLAAERWTAVREKFPDTREAYLRGAQALTALWQYDEADVVLSDGMSRFPDDAELACEAAWLAFNRKVPDEAAGRFEVVRKRFPDNPTGHLGAALVLRDKFQLRDAEALLEEASQQLPNARRLALEYAQLPMFPPLKRDRHPEEAFRRLEQVLTQFPDYEEAYLAMIRFKRQEGCFAEADAVAAIALDHLPESAALAAEHGTIAAELGDWPEAIRRYTQARDRFPRHAGGVVGLAAALSANDRHDEADAVLGEALARFANVSSVFLEHGRIAARREDWPAALARWNEGKRRFPDEREFDHRIFEARLHLTEADGRTDFAMDAGTQVSAFTDPREAMRSLIMDFESLGGRGLGCEFGMFQREFGAEPLGLLRWADMPFDGLIFALENRFEGVGTPENTELFVSRDGARPEWCTTDTRGFMFMRAFVYEDEMPRERMWTQVLRRLVFLKDKLIADLEAGEKIFVYRLTDRNLEPDEVERLHRAVRSYGDNMLLYVRYEDAGHPNGRVELSALGLMIGYTDRFKMSPDGKLSATPPSASWTAICRNAHAIWRERVNLSGVQHKT